MWGASWPELSGSGPGCYWGGGWLPDKTSVCCELCFGLLRYVSIVKASCSEALR